MKKEEFVADTYVRRLARVGAKEIWSVEYVGGETGRVKRAPVTFPSRQDAELHAKAALGSQLR